MERFEVPFEKELERKDEKPKLSQAEIDRRVDALIRRMHEQSQPIPSEHEGEKPRGELPERFRFIRRGSDSGGEADAGRRSTDAEQRLQQDAASFDRMMELRDTKQIRRPDDLSTLREIHRLGESACAYAEMRLRKADPQECDPTWRDSRERLTIARAELKERHYDTVWRTLRQTELP